MSSQDSRSPHGPIDPSLALYPPYYSSSYQQQQSHQSPRLSLPNYSSPSSGGSDTIGTPPTEPSGSSAKKNGKRPASSGGAESRKKQKRDGPVESPQSPATEKEEKPKPTRGSRACTVCRRLKMKCIGAEEGPPCKRCQTGGHECIFEESNRGKRSSKKHEILTRSLRKMERTLDTVLRSIGNPSIASGMISRSPSPPNNQATNTNALLGRTPSPPVSHAQSANLPSSHKSAHHVGTSPKLHSLPDNALNPLGLLAEASLANRRAQQGVNSLGFTARSEQVQNLGVASSNYFKPGPMTILPLRRLYIERQIQPEMLNFVSTSEVVDMFNIYYDHMNMHVNILDRAFHTPSLICSRSPFLLTTICAISSKFYTARPDLHPRLTELAKKLAFSVPSQGYKSVEIVQAYLLLTLWGCGAVERYEQDKTWMLLGMAIRMATDLNLHRKTAVRSTDTEEGRVRDMEVHNRERTWMMCFCLDRSGSALMGKPYTIKEDHIIRNADTWYKLPTAIPSDRSIVAYLDLQRILSRSLEFLHSGTDSPNGLQASCDYMLVIKTFESQIMASRERWATGQDYIQTSLKETPSMNEYKVFIGQFYYNYVLLVLNSYGLQNALERSPLDIGHFFARCHGCAMTCSLLVRDHLGPSGFMKYSPDSHFVQTSYAVLTLLKLLRPEFSAYIEDEARILGIVNDVADVLENISVNTTHTPALYGTFLKVLISAKRDNNNTNNNAGPGLVNLEISNMRMSSSGTPNNLEPELSSSSSALGFHPQLSTQAQSQSQQQQTPFDDPSFMLNEFRMDSEMGPVLDMSTFPPTLASPGLNNTSEDQQPGAGMTMDSILSSGFWDSVLVPGYGSLDGLTGGFVFGAGGSGLITPRMGSTPTHSGQNTPKKPGIGGVSSKVEHLNLAAALQQEAGTS
ncbi:hypothetical protein E1B28_009217 [Marasmius oreades]|uniref:Zn(2)-C6 fungal-type domain-containing protein n=1 Tax=Marasmius oreades TaxID=181124 RepID=A0A9P7USK9_9AGAR|nr:uncharacterized protein E1B28_009217 [Marasmius oreades]KAG7092912.1 hypothetical protein E1B28_009217 [Marasmius oreades]